MWVDRMHGEKCFVPLTKRLVGVVSFVSLQYGVHHEMQKIMLEL